MTIRSFGSGAISLNDLVAEFGGLAGPPQPPATHMPASLQDYYQKGNYVREGTWGFPYGGQVLIPSRGAISLNNFFGSTNKVLYAYDYSTVWTAPRSETIWMMLVAGGGAGGGIGGSSLEGGGGGGAGGVTYGTMPVTAGGQYTITIGAGGAINYQAPQYDKSNNFTGYASTNAGNNGNDTSFTGGPEHWNVNAKGGGGGGGWAYLSGQAGGSGGGGCGYYGSGRQGAGYAGQGNSGGGAWENHWSGGGGGFSTAGAHNGGTGITIRFPVLGYPNYIYRSSFNVGSGGGGGDWQGAGAGDAGAPQNTSGYYGRAGSRNGSSGYAGYGEYATGQGGGGGGVPYNGNSGGSGICLILAGGSPSITNY